MSTQAFRKLIQRYMRGECTEQEIQQVHQWFDNLEGEPLPVISTEERQEIRNRLLDRIDQAIDEPVPLSAVRPLYRRKYWLLPVGVAASLILVWLSYAWMRPAAVSGGQSQAAVFEQGTTLVEYTNVTEQTQSIQLEDHSTVLMSPGSRIAYPKHFRDDRREVQLQGNAFFEVSRNPQRPFFVYCGNTVTQVLGTSFWVKSQEKSQTIEVEVKTGKVSVYENISTQDPAGSERTKVNGVVLTPNQKVTYFSEQHHLVSGLVEKPTLIVPTEAAIQLVFDDTPLLAVLKELEKAYGIDFLITNDQLASYTFTGDLSQMPLDEKLHLICSSTKTSFEIRGTHILISEKASE